jgi:hypothetical protein
LIEDILAEGEELYENVERGRETGRLERFI